MIRGYNQELAQTIYATALAADFDPDNLVERLGSSALDLLTLAGPPGDPRGHRSRTRCEAAVLAKSLLADLLEGMYEGTGLVHRASPTWRPGSYVDDPRRRPALQRHLPGCAR